MKRSNRFHTNLPRTPSSMAWLIKQRASALGRIEHKARQINKLRAERDELTQLFKHIDRVIKQHETQVDPDVIEARPPKRKPLAGYGDMARFVYKALREAAGTPVSTTDLAIGYIRHLGEELTLLRIKDVRQRMHWRMKDMAAAGHAIPCHLTNEQGRVVEGRWLLAPSLLMDDPGGEGGIFPMPRHNASASAVRDLRSH
jgi:hypothetical protein